MSFAKWFPSLSLSDYALTSPQDDKYNCVAWAAADTSHWWEDAPYAGYYWPPDAPAGYRITSLVGVFESLGYQICDGGDYEEGHEKVALYVDSIGDYTHVAKLLPDGWWSSKIGAFEDIKHRSLEVLEGPEYGRVHCIMKRALGPDDLIA
jgi:hypothetical protein